MNLFGAAGQNQWQIQRKGGYGMKKIWIVAVAAVAAVSLTACGVGDVGNAVSSSPASQVASGAASAQTSSVTESSVPNSLAGLQKYLIANAFVTGSPTTMRADMIGAKTGVRYQYSRNGKNNITLELYEYDIANLNEKAQKIISSVKSSGNFTLFGQTISGAKLSQSGKYLMIYKDTASGDANRAYAASTEKLFEDFKANA